MNDINILVVDDIEQNLIAIEALLARPGVNILKASSGPAALELMLVQPVALALVDVQMPQMDGFELAELIRGSDRTRTIPLIFLTAARREPNTTFRGYEAGAVDFLYKPIDAAVLTGKVNVFIELYAQKQQLAQQLDELRQALNMNEIFTAVLGHDLRNPLGSVLTNASLLQKIATDPKIVTAATRIENSGRRMSKMVNQLLDLSRIRAGNLELQLRQTDYETLARSIIEELECRDRTSRIAVRKSGNATGEVDVDRFSQVLSNLLGNALQHGFENEPVTLEIDGTEPNLIAISVANRGHIPAALLPNIFEPFHREEAEDRRSPTGLGLGLYIVKKFVEAHGGQVDLRSSDSEGTIIRLLMPRTPNPGGTSTFTDAFGNLKR